MLVAEASGPVQAPWQMPEQFRITKQHMEEVRARRREAQEHLESLRIHCHVTSDCNEDDMRVLRKSWARALRAVESAVRQEAEMQAFLRYSTLLLNEQRVREQRKAQLHEESADGPHENSQDAMSREVPAQIGDFRPSDETAQEVGVAFAEIAADMLAALLGPRTLYETAQGIGSVFSELAEDALDTLRGAASWLAFVWSPPASRGPSGGGSDDQPGATVGPGVASEAPDV